ncbi:hypothetical protein B0A48_17827 [Cryoendolithus antarcticus]|uniref:Integral membrane protein n=1 Tax=Cryoendolithus antarcticus TaxID=1507870 RepID=A0A1V8SAT6_9PEZI|nr:hypothetical protein B0A48_17827 [Cryoendolithus antarcticus]
MRYPTRPLLLSTALIALLPTALAQSSGVLQSPNSPLPSCASSCGILQQAATACGGLTASSQNIWVCFCQSAYLTTLYQSGEGICADTCATAAERDTLRVWYNGECGTDKGFSEHAAQGQGQGQGTTTVVVTSTSTSAGGAAATSGTGGTSGGSVTSGVSQGQSGGWFKLHWKWILMLILLFVLLLLIALIAVWWKRRHDRKQDLVTSSFNPGITSRSVPGPGSAPGQYAGDGRGPEMGMADPGHQSSGSMPGFDGASPPGGAGSGVLAGTAAGAVGGSGRHTPTRTRDAFMPYGYGYARSESRPASQSYVDQSDTIAFVGESGRGGEGGRGGGESGYAAETTETGGSEKKGKGRVLVRERDAR